MNSAIGILVLGRGHRLTAGLACALLFRLHAMGMRARLDGGLFLRLSGRRVGRGLGRLGRAAGCAESV